MVAANLEPEVKRLLVFLALLWIAPVSPAEPHDNFYAIGMCSERFLELVTSQYRDEGLEIRAGESFTVSGETHLRELWTPLPKGDLRGILRKFRLDNPSPALMKKLVRSQKTGKTEVPVSWFLPPVAAAVHGTQAPCEGSNCVRAVRTFHDPEPKLTGGVNWEYHSTDTFEDWLTDKATPLTSGDRLGFGDMVVIRTFNTTRLPFKYRVSHAMIYLNEHFVWQKASMSPEHPWAFQYTLEEVDFYRTEENKQDFNIQFYRFGVGSGERP